jgi:hypothetical protein
MYRSAMLFESRTSWREVDMLRRSGVPRDIPNFEVVDDSRYAFAKKLQ